jgi:hypothetical protein
MTMMYAFHDALRRDLKEIAHMEHRCSGWDLFEALLHVHHTTEDDALWPVVRERVAGRADDLALLDEMAAEHARSTPWSKRSTRSWIAASRPRRPGRSWR